MLQGPRLTYAPSFAPVSVCLPVLLFLLPFSIVFCHHVMSNHCLAGQALSRAGREQEPQVENCLTGVRMGAEMTVIMGSQCGLDWPVS